MNTFTLVGNRVGKIVMNTLDRRTSFFHRIVMIAWLIKVAIWTLDFKCL